jgi:hypothetical protein
MMHVRREQGTTIVGLPLLPEDSIARLPELEALAARVPDLRQRVFAEDVRRQGWSDAREAAHQYAICYTGDLPFMLSMRRDAVRFRTLSDAKTAGILNCLRADLTRTRDEAGVPAPRPAVRDDRRPCPGCSRPTWPREFRRIAGRELCLDCVRDAATNP